MVFCDFVTFRFLFTYKIKEISVSEKNTSFIGIIDGFDEDTLRIQRVYIRRNIPGAVENSNAKF